MPTALQAGINVDVFRLKFERGRLGLFLQEYGEIDISVARVNSSLLHIAV